MHLGENSMFSQAFEPNSEAACPPGVGQISVVGIMKDQFITCLSVIGGLSKFRLLLVSVRSSIVRRTKRLSERKVRYCANLKREHWQTGHSGN